MGFFPMFRPYCKVCKSINKEECIVKVEFEFSLCKRNVCMLRICD
jgi:hypothetical protein